MDTIGPMARDVALAHCGVQVTDVELPGWDLASRTSDVIIDAEAAALPLATGAMIEPAV